MGPQRHHGGEVVEQGAQIEVQRLQVELARLDLGEVQDVVYEREQRLAAVAHGLGIAPLLLVQVRVQQKAGHADDAVHGRADLVAHVGQKLALGHVGHIGLGRHFVGPDGGLLESAVGLPKSASTRLRSVMSLIQCPRMPRTLPSESGDGAAPGEIIPAVFAVAHSKLDRVLPIWAPLPVPSAVQSAG